MDLLNDYCRAALIREYKPAPDEHDLIGLKEALVFVELLRPADHFHGPVLILEHEQSEAIPLLRGLHRQIYDDSPHRYLIPVRRFLDIAVVEPRHTLDRFGVILQRMAAGIEAQSLLLEGQALFLVTLSD